jgi:hypothetical protein
MQRWVLATRPDEVPMYKISPQIKRKEKTQWEKNSPHERMKQEGLSDPLEEMSCTPKRDRRWTYLLSVKGLVKMSATFSIVGQ